MRGCDAVLLLLLAVPALAQQAPSGAREDPSRQGGLTPEKAVSLALEQSPRLISFRADVAAAKARLAGAQRLFQSNPQLSGTAGPRLEEGRPIDFTVAVSQQLDVFTYGPRVEAARAELEAAQSRQEARQVEVAAEVQQAFARAVAADSRTQLAQEALALARVAVTTAEARLTAGATSRLEVNTARVEVGRAAREVALLTQRRASALAELRLLLGVPVDIALELAVPLPPDEAPALPEGDLPTLALQRRADMRAARQALESARAQGHLAERQVLPTPVLGVSYGRDERTPVVQGSLALVIPLFNQNQAARGQAAAATLQAEGELAAIERAVRIEVELAATRYTTARSAAEQYAGGVLEAMEENLALSTEAYQTGKLSLPELLILRRETLEARRGYIETLEELAVASAQLRRALGSTR